MERTSVPFLQFFLSIVPLLDLSRTTPYKRNAGYSAAKWLKYFDIPIYAHTKELTYINGEIPYPNKKVVEETKLAYMIKPLSAQILNDLPITYYLTPGHSPGHVVYYHEIDKVLMAGDLFITSKTDLHPPVKKFSVDINENIDSGAIIDKIKPNIISSSHGQDLIYNENLYQKYVFWYWDEN
ncbi:MBL fold metallo-hydrolase [Shimazuella sp. AN120528]|uniref:MBL fold metallo-hydrolase n=1 Tax=Shimazuella soli TaxID=1892854 RepID=UPI001F110642|nr:MBL fold metallo-hydrolase [Shimazuella soli]MCH5586706.1 MBL fold metallo-hydrolase [Shimazuella soli]